MFRPLASLVLLWVPCLAGADSTRLGLGLAVVPQYPGADSYRVIPAPSFSFNVGQIAVRSRGPGVEADLFSSRSFDLGPILRYNGGRDPADIDNAAVSALPKVGESLELGVFAALNYALDAQTVVSPRLDVVQGLDGGHEGFLAEGSVNVIRRSGAWTLGAGLSASYADEDYMNAFFGVGAASPSGLAAFTANAGIRDVGIRGFVGYQINETWGVGAAAGITQLVGDAADSPIVDTGSASQGFLSIGATFSF